MRECIADVEKSKGRMSPSWVAARYPTVASLCAPVDPPTERLVRGAAEAAQLRMVGGTRGYGEGGADAGGPSTGGGAGWRLSRMYRGMFAACPSEAMMS